MSATKHSVILAAGGTGGHIFPALALAEQLVARGMTPIFLTDARFRGYTPPETQETLAGMQVIEIATGRNGGGMVVRLRNLLGIAAGVLQAWRVMARSKPSAVIGFGGYPSLPTMLAALLRGERTLLHDQNAYLGRTNRLLARFVRRIALSYEQTHAIPASATHKTTCVGSPVRAAVAVVGEAPYPQRRAGQPFYLLVIGGSQGAKIFSTLVPKAIALLPQEVRARLRLVQQCRSEDNAYVRNTYREMGMEVELAPFFPDIAARMVSAHLVITRAGASSVAEMCVAGRPAIYVPLPSAMDNHQWFNAKLAGDAGAAWLFEESTLTPEILAETLNRAIAEPETLQHMAGLAKTLARPHAAEALCDLVIKEMTA